MRTGDGLIVRVRPWCGTLTATELCVLADIAEQYGNSLIDLTRRANIQIRGLRDDGLPAVWARLRENNLIDPDIASESLRNIVASPLAGIDPIETVNIQRIASDLGCELSRQVQDLSLPGKFGFSVDGGGLLSLEGTRADIRLQAVASSAGARMAIGVERPRSIKWLCLVPVEEACAVAIQIARAFIAVRGNDDSIRMRALTDEQIEALADAVATQSERLPPIARRPENEVKPLGIILHDQKPIAFGVAMPFGRIEAPALRMLGQRAMHLGITEFRLSPWRSFYMPVTSRKVAQTLADMAAELGFITSSSDPLLAIDACPGAPACRSAHLDTRAVAFQLASQIRKNGFASVHVSGCAKGCARSEVADVVIVGDVGRCAVMRGDTAHGTPALYVATDCMHDLQVSSLFPQERSHHAK
jgi:precorrin-3B synthase